MASNKNYQKGRRFEYALMSDLKDYGYLVMRTAGSHGPFDVIGINPTTGHIQLIQAKVTESPAVAERLLNAFRNGPPIAPGLLGTKTAQVMAVKVTGESEWRKAIV